MCNLVALQYRQIQILALLANNCLETYILPDIQISGATFVISLLYASIIFEKYLPASATALIFFIFSTFFSILYIIFDMGSRPAVKSRKFLKAWRKYNRLFKSDYTRKFIQSCSEIVLKVGSFHVLDRSRAPSFMRFVLQRTFFLVKSTGDIGEVTLSLPF